MYIYESHTGGIYKTKFFHEVDELYCDLCGDWDRYIGEANTKKEFIELFEPFDAEGYSTSMFRYAKEYILKQAEELFVAQDEGYEKGKSEGAKPVRHGKWVKRFGSINCSVCKHSNWSNSFEHLVRSFNYCPNCGARMKGADDDNDKSDE